MKIALAQINPTVGDVPGNSAKIAAAIERAEAAGAELVVFSELAVTGCPPGDLLSRSSFVAASVAAVESLARRCEKVAALVGFVRPAADSSGGPLENAAALLADGNVSGVHVKTLLPTDGVFDEARYFRPGPPPQPMTIRGRRVGVSLCAAPHEDDPGAEIIVNMSAGPFRLGRPAVREDLIRRQADRSGAAVVYVNQVGGNDELIFDGFSVAVSPDGTVLGRAKPFEEDLLVVETTGRPGRCEPVPAEMEQLASALKLGLCDYVRKCGFASVVLGLSGGLDSAVVAVLAADALGPGNVLALAMPSRYSSDRSLTDARQLARNLGVRLLEVPIAPVHEACDELFAAHLPADRPGTTDENIQARIRGNLVMAFSNACGHLPLATGNKSELATGYCTLYGDMTGGLAVIGDVPKTMVYELARHLNEVAGAERISESILTKPPSAELKSGQTDQEKLPPYDVLDEILLRYVERRESVEQIVQQGFDAQLVRKVARMVAAAEFKRRQAPPALKVTARALGPGRRLPIACKRDVE